MKKIFFYLSFTAILLTNSCSFTNNKFNNPSKEKLIIEVITYLLQKESYSKPLLNDDFSKKVFDNFLKNLDPEKRLFTKSSLRKLQKYKTQIDDQINDESLDFFEDAYTLFLERYKATKAIYKNILATPYDFNISENTYINYDSISYVSNDKELENRWRKQLKQITLITLNEKLKTQKDSAQSKKKSIATLEKEAREATKKNIKIFDDFFNEQERSDWFAIYVNTILETIDPHTSYFNPDDRDRFDTSMSGKFEGIGAQLEKKDNHIIIRRVILGGPAWKQEALEEGDIILKVAQSKDEEPVSIGGMRIRDAVKLIKGPKDSTVYLTIKHPNGNIEIIQVIRGIVELEETYLKTALTETPQGKFAVIRLPKFYIDFEDYKNQRNAASDMKKELERLNKLGVDGVLIDLRSNGGGSLKTVIDIGGMFIPEGPIVQVNNSKNKKTVLEDSDPNILWSKPLVILVNELSASASEILAAAMQDYKRAIIMGSKQTYGKGTVQNLVDLNTTVKNSNLGDLGALKLTTQKFYRINGGSTQIKGVQSDIVIPDKYTYIGIGERQSENAMPWDKINTAPYTAYDNAMNFSKVIANSQKRIAESDYFSLIDKQAHHIKKESEDYKIPLDLKSFQQEINHEETYNKRFDLLGDYESDLSFYSMPYELQLAEQDTVIIAKANRWHKNLTKDFYLTEAIKVLGDLTNTNMVYSLSNHSEE